MIISDYTKSSASFRDPSGFVFTQNGRIYRAITILYKEDYDLLMSSGLYARLINETLLIPHTEIDEVNKTHSNIYKIIQPEEIKFISYPYEWCFSQLKDAALLTLRMQRIALEYGMILKDASSFNIQFRKGLPVFIDTLSFEKYVEGKPWIAYRQFCTHFLAPLLLMKYRDLRMNKLLSLFIDGIPLDLTKSLLPFQSFLKVSNFSHIYLHSLSETYTSSKSARKRNLKITKNGMFGLIENLEKSISKINLKVKKSVWRDYYSDNSYRETEFEKKQKIIDEYIKIINPQIMIDLGANTGFFSRIASERGIYTISSDFDPHCVELNYLEVKKKNEKNILPLVIDLTNPSPSLGWHNVERDSFLKRNKVDAIMALALIHHLAISNNVPFEKLALFFSALSDYLVLEFVPKEDIQVKSLLANRKDIYVNYNQAYFEEIFRQKYNIIKKNIITDSNRTLYLMKLK